MINDMCVIKVAGNPISMLNRSRPVFLNPFRIHLPVMGWVSIVHRLTGMLLFLLLPLPLWLWQLSLSGSEDFELVRYWFDSWPLRFVLLLMLWWFLHHLFAGIRVLLLDMEIGSGLQVARISAVALLVLDGVLLIGGILWL